jgi:hypothetical protein
MPPSASPRARISLSPQTGQPLTSPPTAAYPQHIGQGSTAFIMIARCETRCLPGIRVHCTPCADPVNVGVRGGVAPPQRRAAKARGKDVGEAVRPTAASTAGGWRRGWRTPRLARCSRAERAMARLVRAFRESASRFRPAVTSAAGGWGCGWRSPHHARRSRAETTMARPVRAFREHASPSTSCAARDSNPGPAD